MNKRDKLVAHSLISWSHQTGSFFARAVDISLAEPWIINTYTLSIVRQSRNAVSLREISNQLSSSSSSAMSHNQLSPTSHQRHAQSQSDEEKTFPRPASPSSHHVTSRKLTLSASQKLEKMYSKYAICELRQVRNWLNDWRDTFFCVLCLWHSFVNLSEKWSHITPTEHCTRCIVLCEKQIEHRMQWHRKWATVWEKCFARRASRVGNNLWRDLMHKILSLLSSRPAFLINFFFVFFIVDGKHENLMWFLSFT